MPRKIIAKNNDERIKHLLSALMDISPDEISEVRITEESRPERDLPPCIAKIDELDARITAIERILRLS